MEHPLKTLTPNLVGRDFVIGDLHGSFSAFENLLKNINFDPAVDRMISVCDLVDRGPESLKCLGLLRHKWFHSTLANHEHMMLEKFKGGQYGQYWFQNGGDWGMEAYTDFKNAARIPADDSAELFDLIPLVEELPYLITVETKSGKKFHVLHAELPTNAGLITDERLSDPSEVLKLATMQRGDGDAFLWARSVFYNFYSVDLSNHDKNVKRADSFGTQNFNDNLSHIISGHSVVQHPLTVVGQTNIDTGAYKSYSYPASGGYGSATIMPVPWAALTCVELDSWKFYKATETSFMEVDPVVVTREDLSNI